MRRRLCLAWIPVCSALLIGTGCGGNDDDDTDEADATVTADGAPGADGPATVDAAPTVDSPSSTTCPDEYTNVEGECDILLQDCDVGYWCMIISAPNAAATCVENGSGTVDKGGACTAGNHQCMPGLICAQQHCTPYCCPSTDQPCGAGTCNQYIYYGVPAYARICSY